jgi:hypothetical protein
VFLFSNGFLIRDLNHESRNYYDQPRRNHRDIKTR